MKQTRFQSTGVNTGSGSPGTANANAGGASHSSAFGAGVAGGLLVLAAGYSYYHFSGAKTIVNTAHQTKQRIDQAFRSSSSAFTSSSGTPDAHAATQWLRDTITPYARFIPGASGYVDQAFKDIEKVQEKHGDELNKIVKQTYDELKDITKDGASVETASRAWEVLQKCMKHIGQLAGDAAGDVMNEHPELKEKFGKGYKQLQQYGEQFGPEAKKQVEDTKKQVEDIYKQGLNSDNINKIQKLIQEKTEQIKGYGENAWKQGMEKAQPALEKYPELKEQVEKNKDKLLQGDLGQLWQKLQQAAKSGDVDDAKKFVSDQLEKGQQTMSQGGGGGGFESLLAMFPHGKDVGGKFQQLQELSQKHGKEAENLVKSAFEDIKKVLEKKVEEGQSLKEKAEKDAKS